MHICVFITAPRSVHDCIDACPPAEVVVRLTPVAGGLDDAKRNEQWACSAAFQLGKHGVSTPRPIPSQNGRLVESVACAGDSGTCRGGVLSVTHRALGRGFHPAVDALNPALWVAWGRALASMHVAAARLNKSSSVKEADVSADGKHEEGTSTPQHAARGNSNNSNNSAAAAPQHPALSTRRSWSTLPILAVRHELDASRDAGQGIVARALQDVLLPWLTRRQRDTTVTTCESYGLIHSDFHFGNMFLAPAAPATSAGAGAVAGEDEQTGALDVDARKTDAAGGTTPVPVSYDIQVLDFGEAHYSWFAFDIAFVLSSVDLNNRTPSPKFRINTDAFASTFLGAYREAVGPSIARFVDTAPLDAFKLFRACVEYLHMHKALTDPSHPLPDVIRPRMLAYQALLVEDLSCAAGRATLAALAKMHTDVPAPSDGT